MPSATTLCVSGSLKLGERKLVLVQFLIEQSEVVFFSQLRVEPTRFVRIIDGSLYAYAKPTYPLYHVS